MPELDETLGSEGDLGPSEHPYPAGTLGRLQAHYHRLPARQRHLVVAAVVLVGLLLLYGLVQVYARAQVREAEVVVQQVWVSGGDPSAESLTLRLECRIENPSAFSATIRDSRLQVLYLDELAGVVQVPSLELDPGDNQLELSVNLENRNAPPFAALTYQLLAHRALTVTIQGEIEVDSLLDLTLPVDKQVKVEGLAF